MTYRTSVLPNGRIDADALPSLPPGTQVQVVVSKTSDSLEELFRVLDELKLSSKEIYRGPYNRKVIYEEE